VENFGKLISDYYLHW